MKKIYFVLMILFGILAFFLFSKSLKLNNSKQSSIENTSDIEIESLKNNELSSIEELNLHDIDGKDENYSFLYKGEEFSVLYEPDNWHIYNSYKITNKHDIAIICQALIEIHPIHSADLKSFRTAKDMAEEWVQHNLAYNILPEENAWKEHAKNVDLDPKDQGKNLMEMYQQRNKK